MKKKQVYSEPEVRCKGLHVETGFLVSATVGSTGENLETGEEFDPWQS